jgi:hypothetical protein
LAVYEAIIDHLVNHRKEHLPGLVRSGLNFSIVLGSACYVEGVLETLLRTILQCRRSEFNSVEIGDFDLRRAINTFFQRVETELAGDIGRATGAAGYDDMFALIAGHRLSDLMGVKPLWEGITVLFNFRNVLGHGREVSARHYAGGIPGGFKEEFTGGYRIVEDYLRKKQLLSRKFVDAHSEFLYLSSDIADHFWQLARALPNAAIASLPDGERDACRLAIKSAAADANRLAQ